MGELCFGQNIPKLPENYEKMLFFETYFKEGNINWKPYLAKIKEKCYFKKPNLRRVISARNHLFGPIIR